MTTGPTDRAARGARRQALFREVNEHVDRLSNAGWSITPDENEYVCECTDETCTERIRMPAAHYDRLRSRARCFVVAPSMDHVVPEIERVVARSRRYWVVEKLGTAGAVAESLDRRP
jgi:hypothetical protein